jgi:isocitrate dehydrogenase kinase/phosphatase
VSETDLILRGARAIHQAFLSALGEFHAITRRARQRFEQRDWAGGQADGARRLECYGDVIPPLVHQLRELLERRASSEAAWHELRQAYAAVVGEERNFELAQTFFNSATRRVFSTIGVNPHIEFVSTESAVRVSEPDPATYRRYLPSLGLHAVLRQLLDDYRFRVDYRDPEGDARRAAERMERYLKSFLGAARIDAVETLRPVFFRHKAAYVVGRVRSGPHRLPLVLPLHHEDGGIAVDAVLMDENEVSILFSFTRAYFQVDTDCPREIIVFLKSIMPQKPVAELYIALGYNKHGKTELYRDFLRHLSRSSDRFQFAEGDRGMVMLVFTLPSYDVVFKVIRDHFDYPKTQTRRDVMNRYRLVFRHDRVGRLVDAQEFQQLKLSRERFSDDLLRSLLEQASQAVSLEGNQVVIHHVYIERRLTPLNVYLRQAPEDAARRAVLDYGRAIQELAAANIFPGDFLLKNFGVTRHGRVVFYDYDELCLLTDCNFRTIPPARDADEELSSEPWFTVAPNDIFPEEFRKFLGLPPRLRSIFVRNHGWMFEAQAWRALQARHRAGELLNFLPYPERRRLDSAAPL